MSRAFWFVLGAGTAVAAYLKGRSSYRRLMPASVQRRVESSVAHAASRAAQFADTYRTARAEKESELTARLRTIERGQLE